MSLRAPGLARTHSDVLVLCYHGVSQTWPAATAIRPDQLERQLGALLRWGYEGSTFSKALTSPRSRRTVAITFDDAHRSVMEVAYPIMLRLGIPGTVFVPTAFPDSGRPLEWEGVDMWLGGPYEREIACMSWSELRCLAESGWEIGSHTRSHPHLTQVDHQRLEDEVRRSRSDVETHLERECTSIAYPYGECDARVAQAAWDAGYRVGATVSIAYPPPLPLQWPRIAVDRHEALRFHRRVSPVTRRLAQTRRGQALFAGARGAKALGRRVTAKLPRE